MTLDLSSLGKLLRLVHERRSRGEAAESAYPAPGVRVDVLVRTRHYPDGALLRVITTHAGLAQLVPPAELEFDADALSDERIQATRGEAREWLGREVPRFVRAVPLAKAQLAAQKAAAERASDANWWAGAGI